MNALETALNLAREQFAAHLGAFGVDATWRRRSSTAVTTSGDISERAQRPDPNDTGWVRELDDPRVYPTAGTIRVLKDVPEDVSFQNVGHLLAGQTIGYTTHDVDVRADDILEIDGGRWHVDGSRLVSPAVYRELTLRRI